MIQGIFKKISRKIKASSLYSRIFSRHKKREEIHDFWRSPTDGNLPEMYAAEDIRLTRRSEFLLGLLEPWKGKDIKILEVGCNAGRNLKHLFDHGFRNLEAIEISEKAVAFFRDKFPETASNTRIHNCPVEDIIKTFPDNSFEIVFTMAVLEHIHTDSEWIFKELVRITAGTLITIEDEKGVSWRHFPRNYKAIFEPLGLTQVQQFQCEDALHGLGNQFFARVFSRP